MASAQKVMLLTTSRKIGSKVKSNRNRRLRRKRNKKFFLLKLKAKRAARTEESLCESIIDIFDINGERSEHNMQSAGSVGSASFAASLQDVAEWQNQHQLAYWKSKALALQMENQMLHKHIKHLYDNQMEQYLTYKNNAWKDAGTDYNTKRDVKHSNLKGTQHNQNPTKMVDTEEEVDEYSLPPGEQPGEQRRKKLLEMYGDNAAKINGMETAMQLNFDHCVIKEKLPYWPNLPLKM